MTMNATPTMNRRAFFRRSVPIPWHQPLPFKAGLEPYAPSADEPWDRRRVAHLLRRTGFGAPVEKINEFLAMDPLEAVDKIVDDAIAWERPALPIWAFDPEVDNEERNIQRIKWMESMRENGLPEKMALFWSNHFVTEIRNYQRPAYMIRYLDLLRKHALGNFRQFTYDIGIEPAMLIYLNGNSNRKGGPNENYARELLELFTMGITSASGQQNYTQQDIEEIARALTGWIVNRDTTETEFKENRHDTNSKTFFRRSGNFGYDEVIDIIFEERTQETAHFVCRKIYKFFVYAEPDETIVSEMADQFVAENFEIAPVLRTLLRSGRFMENATLSTKIKSPQELMQGFAVELGVEFNNEASERFLRHSEDLTQELLEPPNVAGWTENRTWLSTETLPNRWDYLTRMIKGQSNYLELDPVPYAKTMSDPTKSDILSREIADHLLGIPQTEETYKELEDVMLGGGPDYEWDIDDPMAKMRLQDYLIHLSQLPEFQLC